MDRSTCRDYLILVAELTGQTDISGRAINLKAYYPLA
jgi:hypothetical protein